MPDLDLAGPVAGGCGGRQNGMLGNTQAGLAVGGQDVQRPGVVVIVEVSGAGAASRGQDRPIQRKVTLHRVTLHLGQVITRFRHDALAATRGNAKPWRSM